MPVPMFKNSTKRVHSTSAAVIYEELVITTLKNPVYGTDSFAQRHTYLFFSRLKICKFVISWFGPVQLPVYTYVPYIICRKYEMTLLFHLFNSGTFKYLISLPLASCC
jgi:hypothetical protein